MPESTPRKPLQTAQARSQSRDVRITFRLTLDEAEALHREAAARDIEVSRLIRRWLLMGRRVDDAALGRQGAGA